MEDTSFSPWLLCVFLFIVTCVFAKGHFSQKKEPPGPGVLHFIKNMLFKSRQLSETHLKELSRKYGDVFTIYLGLQKYVVVTGWKAVTAVLNEDGFSSKSQSPIILDMRLSHGLVFTNGVSWKEMRKFIVTNLKQFGMGKNLSQERIMEEVQYLMEVFEEKQGQAFDTSLPVSLAISNVICSIIYGHRFEYGDQNFKATVERLSTNSRLLACPSIQLYNSFPKLFMHIKEREQLMKSSLANRNYVTQLISRSEETLEPHKCRSVIDAFLLKKKQLEETGIENSHYHKENLIATNINLLAGGTDSTASTLRYGLLLMAKYPDVQDQVHMELDRVVGSRPVQADDVKSLPFTQAVIQETQRLFNVFPLLHHLASKDMSFEGYAIKKGTPIIVLLSSVLQDEDKWEKPHTFNPGHFLDDDGNLKGRDAFIPFSDGPRSCVGRNLAKMSLLMFFASLLQRFRFTPPPGVNKEDLDLTRVPGLTFSPSPHQLCATKRI